MSFGNSKECTCLECGVIFPHAKKLSEHFKKAHKMSPIDYCIKHSYDNVRPLCITCGGETRFVCFTDGFKRYCSEHRKDAEAAGGHVGGHIKKQWNKGKTKDTDERLAVHALKMTGSGNHFFGKKHTEESNQRNADAHRLPFDAVVSRIIEVLPTVSILSPPTDYASQDDLLRIVCTTCSVEDRASFFNLQCCWRCKTCYPIASRPQLEVADFVKSLGFSDVHVSTRQIIPPLELDVWVPEKNVAIEYHGLYWHSGGKSDVFDKGRHRQKLDACRAADIRLLQFFSDEWTNRGNVCRSIIANALGASAIKLNARDCDVVELSSAQSRAFVDANHVSGGTRAKHHIGLVHPIHGLVGVASTRTPIQKKHGNLCELARMCFLSGTSVRGGASKLLVRVCELAQSDGFEGVLSYADLRFGDGGVYEKCGFTLLGDSGLSYGYTDGHRRFDRFKFRAQKPKTEKQVADENGVRPVWGCGHRIYVKRFVTAV